MKFQMTLTLENEIHGPRTASATVTASTPAAALSRGFKAAKKELKHVHWESAVVLLRRVEEDEPSTN